jgi:hypothetical protein
LVSFFVVVLFALMALGSARSDKSSTTTTTSAIEEPGVGRPLTVGKAEWTVLDVLDRGTTMKPTNQFSKDATTSGRFIQVHFRVANKGKEPGSLMGAPKLADDKSREFGRYQEQFAYLPKDGNSLTLETIQPSMSKDFYEIYELPADATTLSIKVPDFGFLGSTKSIPLGNIPLAPVNAESKPETKAAPPATAKATSAAAKPSTAGTGKAKR